jgi:hypothetical protein
MHTESNDFEQLRKLLALKRHEQPPPRYFNEFSSNVIARLRMPELLPQPTLLQRLGLDFNFQPAMVGVFGVIVSALMLTGVIAFARVDTTPTMQAMGAGPLEVGEVGWSSGPMPGLTMASHRIDNFGETPASTVPVLGAPSASPFSQLGVQASKINWAFSGGQN